MIRFFLIFTVMLTVLSTVGYGQQKPIGAAKTAAAADKSVPAVKMTAAYAELLLRRTDLAAEVEDMTVSYTDEFPKLKAARFELDLLDKQLAKLLAVVSADTPKLTLALGKLLVRKAALETDLWVVRGRYGDDHPDVIRARRKVDTFETAIKEILP